MGSRKVEDGGGGSGGGSSSSGSDSPFATLEPSEEEEAEQEEAAEEDASKKRKRRDSSSMVACTSLSWIPQALASMKAVALLINGREELRAHPSPLSCLSDLRRIRAAAMDLVHDTDDTIQFAQTRFESIEKKILREQVLGLEGELVRQQELLQAAMAQSAHYSKLCVHARRKSSTLAALLQQERAESSKKMALLHCAKMEASKQAALLEHACADVEKKQSTCFACIPEIGERDFDAQVEGSSKTHRSSGSACLSYRAR